MSDDILKDIDDAVQEARQDLCGCGCQQRLQPNGPSLYYATQACQERHQRALCQDPRAAARGDRTSMFTAVGWDARAGAEQPWPEQLLRAVRREQSRLSVDNTDRRTAMARLFDSNVRRPFAAAQHGARNMLNTISELAYQRFCATCQAVTMPCSIMAGHPSCPDDVRDAPRDVGPADPTLAAQFCGNCGEQFAVTVTPIYQMTDGRHLFHVRCRTGRGDIASNQLLLRSEELAEDTATVARQVWVELTHTLLNQLPPVSERDWVRDGHRRWDVNRFLARMSDILGCRETPPDPVA